MKVISLDNFTGILNEPSLIYEMTVQIQPEEALKLNNIFGKLSKEGKPLHLKIDKRRYKK